MGKIAVPGAVLLELDEAFRRVGAPADSDRGKGTFGDHLEWTNFEVQAMLREVVWRESGALAGSDGKRHDGQLPSWQDSTVRALSLALVESQSARVPHAGGTHLLLGLIEDSDGPAALLLQAGEVDRIRLIDRLRSDLTWSTDAEPHAPLVEMLEMAGGVDAPTPWLVRWVPALMRRGAANRSRYGGSMLHCLEYEIARQAVRMKSSAITSAHVVLAVTALADQLAAAGRHLSGRTAAFNSAVDVLPRHHVLLSLARTASNEAHEETDTLSSGEAQKIFWVHGPPWARRLAEAMDRSIALARGLGHSEVGTSHLLVVLLGDENSAAYRLVTESGEDAQTIRSQLDASLR